MYRYVKFYFLSFFFFLGGLKKKKKYSPIQSHDIFLPINFYATNKFLTNNNYFFFKQKKEGKKRRANRLTNKIVCDIYLYFFNIINYI